MLNAKDTTQLLLLLICPHIRKDKRCLRTGVEDAEMKVGHRKAVEATVYWNFKEELDNIDYEYVFLNSLINLSIIPICLPQARLKPKRCLGGFIFTL